MVPRRRVAVQAGPRAVLVIGERERAVSGFSSVRLAGRPVCSVEFRDGSQRVPFLVPIQVDQTSSIECQSVILVFAFNNTRRGRLAG